MGWFESLEIAMRQKDLAIEVRKYLKTHSHAAVINLGCGLDQTGENCDNGSCHIYNIDFPDVIEVRNALLPVRERVTNIAAAGAVKLMIKGWVRNSVFRMSVHIFPLIILIKRYVHG